MERAPAKVSLSQILQEEQFQADQAMAAALQREEQRIAGSPSQRPSCARKTREEAKDPPPRQQLATSSWLGRICWLMLSTGATINYIDGPHGSDIEYSLHLKWINLSNYLFSHLVLVVSMIRYIYI